jgi:hypothetical protein
MGLTLHYELRLPPDTSREEAASLLCRLRDAAAATAVEHVSPFVDISVGEENFPDGDDGRPWRVMRLIAECLADPMLEEGETRFSGDPLSAMGFVVDPGRGAETATVGLMHRRHEGASTGDWFWWCSCKTQYASTVSDEHFVAVHTALVAILDAAMELGFDVEVHDEGGYWESRSTDALVAEVTRMNRLMAKFGGALSDALGEQHEVQAPIFEHRSFERLEME